MIPEQLKLSILQSAFQGKLTGECVPNETADDLYHQIQSEKQRLISEKKSPCLKSLLMKSPLTSQIIGDGVMLEIYSYITRERHKILLVQQTV